MKPTPYSYAVGVENTRVKVAEEATLDDLIAEHGEPVQLDTPSIKYHNADKKERTAIKKRLPYFVGGVLGGKRHDDNVRERTLLTLDIEAKENKDGTTGTQPPGPDAVTDRLEELGAAGWVYTSLSHTPRSPRYRVVLPLGRPIRGDATAMASALKASTLAAAKTLGIEEWCRPESWVLSQAMYLPAKLKGGTYYQSVHHGKGWRTAAVHDEPVGGTEGKDGKRLADIPDERPDEVLAALKAAGLYLGQKRPGMHFITCPCADQHGAENDSQTVYYEAHFDGNPRPAVKCFDTDPDEDGRPHLTFRSLVRNLVEGGHLSRDQQHNAGVLDDYDVFTARASLGHLLDTTPVPREWAVEQFAPVGKVTVLAGPGGVSKSMLMLHILAYGALGQEWAGFRPQGPLRSLYVSYEDDTMELHSRVHALARALQEVDDGALDMLHDVGGAIRKNLLMYAADDEAMAWLLMTKPDKYGVAERTERVNWLIGFLKHAGIRILVLDPAVYTHQLEENSIADMAAYMQTLTAIAKQGNVAVVVLHHMHKTAAWHSIDEVNQGSLRGASSFADNARSVGVMVSMPIKDAPNYGLDADQNTASSYAVFKHVKHNYSASLGTLVFERRGPLLMPRPDVQKLQGAELVRTKAEKLAEAQAEALNEQCKRVVEFLMDHDDFATATQVAAGARLHKRSVREVLEFCADNDWAEVETGPRGSLVARVTRNGKRWLRDGAGKKK